MYPCSFSCSMLTGWLSPPPPPPRAESVSGVPSGWIMGCGSTLLLLRRLFQLKKEPCEGKRRVYRSCPGVGAPPLPCSSVHRPGAFHHTRDGPRFVLSARQMIRVRLHSWVLIPTPVGTFVYFSPSREAAAGRWSTFHNWDSSSGSLLQKGECKY